MPSKLPIIKANTTQENIDKMKVIAGTNKRSVAKELEWLIERHIAEFEAKHGDIVIPDKTAAMVEMLRDKNVPFKEKAKESFKFGIEAGKNMDLSDKK